MDTAKFPHVNVASWFVACFVRCFSFFGTLIGFCLYLAHVRPKNGVGDAVCEEIPAHVLAWCGPARAHPLYSIMSGAARFSSFWRVAGLNYLEQVNVATNALRRVLKEPMRSEVMGRSAYSFRKFTYEGAVEHKPGTCVSQNDWECTGPPHAPSMWICV